MDDSITIGLDMMSVWLASFHRLWMGWEAEMGPSRFFLTFNIIEVC